MRHTVNFIHFLDSNEKKINRNITDRQAEWEDFLNFWWHTFSAYIQSIAEMSGNIGRLKIKLFSSTFKLESYARSKARQHSSCWRYEATLTQITFCELSCNGKHALLQEHEIFAAKLFSSFGCWFQSFEKPMFCWYFFFTNWKQDKLILDFLLVTSFKIYRWKNKSIPENKIYKTFAGDKSTF